MRYGTQSLRTSLRLTFASPSRGYSFERLESRALMNGSTTNDLRTYDGTRNNLFHPDWGTAGTTLLRLVRSAYGDGVSSPAGQQRPSARVISNAVAAHPDEETPSANHLSAFAYQWGQFIDHDLDLTTAASPAEPFNVRVPKGDPQFDPLGTGTQVIPLSRSDYTTVRGVRQQINDITAYLDGSMVYGSDPARARDLRELSGGRMKLDSNGLLPLNKDGLPNANDAHRVPDNQLFLAGDVRANENVELTSLQTLFVREHNRLAAQIATANRWWSDERIYQQARRLVIGEIQHITYDEFLPTLLGGSAMPSYAGYDSSVNAGISTEFSTAGFRLGHSLLANDVEFITNDGHEARDEISLADAFFNPDVVKQNGIDTILKYLASSNSEELDNRLVDGVRNLLFGQPGSGALDLASLNIQRGRDHGLADYNTTRAALGLPRVTSFGQITSNADLAMKLKSLYGSVDNVDLWVGGLAEDHVAGSNLGATFQRIVVDQFTRTRTGDRFWYERDLSGSDLNTVHNTTLAKIIAANTTSTNLQPNAFVFDVSVSGTLYYDTNRNGSNDREPPLGGILVQLLDDEGNLVGTARSDRRGRYTFGSVQIGDQVVDPIAPPGLTAPSVAVAVTRGGLIDGVDIGFRSTRYSADLLMVEGPTQRATLPSVADDVLV